MAPRGKRKEGGGVSFASLDVEERTTARRRVAPEKKSCRCGKEKKKEGRNFTITNSRQKRRDQRVTRLRNDAAGGESWENSND